MNASRRITFLTVGLLLILAITVGLSLYIIARPLAPGLAGAAGTAGTRSTEGSYVLSCPPNIPNLIFQSATGLGVNSEVTEQRVTDNGKESTRLAPGRLQFPALVLKRALTDDQNVWKWRKQVADGDIRGARLNCSIKFVDSSANVFASWDLLNAWPSTYTVGTVTGTGTDTTTGAPIETVSIVYEGLNRTK